MILPTYAQMKDPSKIPQAILDKLAAELDKYRPHHHRDAEADAEEPVA